MENKEHVLLLILGKSASGKDFLTNKLCERAGLNQLISYTTRPRRVNEGDTHIFVTESDYEQMKSEGKIAAFTQIGDYKYWSTTNQLYTTDCYIIDYTGLKTLRELNLPGLRFVTVFINTPDSVREDRALNKRKDDKIAFRKRSLAEREQFREMQKNADFDYSISNIEWPKAYSVLRHISDIEGVWKNHLEEEVE